MEETGSWAGLAKKATNPTPGPPTYLGAVTGESAFLIEPDLGVLIRAA